MAAPPTPLSPLIPPPRPTRPTLAPSPKTPSAPPPEARRRLVPPTPPPRRRGHTPPPPTPPHATGCNPIRRSVSAPALIAPTPPPRASHAPPPSALTPVGVPPTPPPRYRPSPTPLAETPPSPRSATSECSSVFRESSSSYWSWSPPDLSYSRFTPEPDTPSQPSADSPPPPGPPTPQPDDLPLPPPSEPLSPSSSLEPLSPRIRRAQSLPLRPSPPLPDIHPPTPHELGRRPLERRESSTSRHRILSTLGSVFGMKSKRAPIGIAPPAPRAAPVRRQHSFSRVAVRRQPSYDRKPRPPPAGGDDLPLLATTAALAGQGTGEPAKAEAPAPTPRVSDAASDPRQSRADAADCAPDESDGGRVRVVRLGPYEMEWSVRNQR